MNSANDSGSHKKLLGLAIHNWIFVGIFLGFFLGWGTFSLDHMDDLKTKDQVYVGYVEKTGDTTYKVTDVDGQQSVVEAKDATLTKASAKSSYKNYSSLVWIYNLLGKVIFMGILKMLIAPLIFASIVAGIVSLKDLDQLRRIGLKTMTYYVVTTTLAVSIGLAAVLLIKPGLQPASLKVRERRAADIAQLEQIYKKESGKAASNAGKATTEFKLWLADKESEKFGSGHEAAKFKKLLKAKNVTAGEMIKKQLIKPMLTNPFNSLSHTNSLGIIFFAVLLGIAVVIVGDPARSVADFFTGFNEVMIAITTWLMSVAPIFIMFIVAELIAQNGPNVFGSLIWYCITVISGIAVHVVLLLCIAYFVGNCSPIRLWNGLREAWLVAFTTRSSAATLPITMRCVTKNLGVSPRVANFGLPVGATMNMDGTALYEGVAVIFLIQIFQPMADVPIVLDAATTFIIFITAVFASVGAAAVPDAGLVTMVIVAGAVGLPVYYIPLIFAVDAFLDMFRTSTNVLGDAIGTIVVQNLEGEEAVAPVVTKPASQPSANKPSQPKQTNTPAPQPAKKPAQNNRKNKKKKKRRGRR